MVLAGATARAGRDDLAPGRGPALGLRLRVLGPSDVGGPLGRGGAAAGPSELDRPQRDRRPEDATARHASAAGAPASCDRPRRAVGAGTAGGGRLVGRDSTAVGLVARDAGGARTWLRGRNVRARPRRLGGIHDP